jgi:hypothetical protein
MAQALRVFALRPRQAKCQELIVWITVKEHVRYLQKEALMWEKIIKVEKCKQSILKSIRITKSL